MRFLVMLLGYLHITVSARNLKMALRYHSHPSLIKRDMKDFCDRYIDLSEGGRNSGTVLSLEIPLKDIASNFSCTTALAAPKNCRVLVALKKMKIPIPGASCTDYVMIFNGGLNSTDTLSNKICGYYDDNHSPRVVYYSRTTSSTLSIKVSKQAHEDYNLDFGLTLIFTVFSRSQRGRCPDREQTLCDNKICIWKHFRCNDHNNCGDGSDEKQCEKNFPVDRRNGTRNSKAYIIFLGTIMVLIILIIAVVASRFKKQFCCCGTLDPEQRISGEQTSRDAVASTAAAEEHGISPPPYGYDNNGYAPEPPPSYEEALASRDIQRQNQHAAGDTIIRPVMNTTAETASTPTAPPM